MAWGRKFGSAVYRECRLLVERRGGASCVVRRTYLHDPSDTRLVYPLDMTLECSESSARARARRRALARLWPECER